MHKFSHRRRSPRSSPRGPGPGSTASPSAPTATSGSPKRSADRVGNINPTLATINEFSAGITAGAAPTNIVSGADGNLWFTESTNNAIGRITTAGVVTEFSLAALGAGTGPLDIVSDPANNLLYFTENNTGQIGRINPLAGSNAQILASETQSAVVPSGAGAGVNGITLGPDGNLWFTEMGVDRIGNINPTLTTINEFSAGIPAGAAPTDIVTGPDGALWFTESATNAIGRITTGGAVIMQSNKIAGIEISGGNNNTVGGVTAGLRNVVDFNAEGIEIDNGGQQQHGPGQLRRRRRRRRHPGGQPDERHRPAQLQRLQRPPRPAQPNEPGVSNNLVGGTAAGAGNLVEFNGAAGVAVFGNPVSASGQPNIGNAIEGNSIFENGRNYLSLSSAPTPLLGIDLSNQFVFPKDDGFTPNDSKGHGAANDPNNFQNFPVLTSATTVPGGVQIVGTLTQSVSPNTTYRIEFFASNVDPLGLPAEGQQFLGFLNVTTDANGNASFSAVFNVPVATGAS